MKNTSCLIHFTHTIPGAKIFQIVLLLYNPIQASENISSCKPGGRFSRRENYELWKKRSPGKQKLKIIQIKVGFYHGFLSWKVCEHSPLGAVIFTKFKIKMNNTKARHNGARIPLLLFSVVRDSTFEGTIKTHPFGRWWVNRRQRRVFHLATRLLPVLSRNPQ